MEPLKIVLCVVMITYACFYIIVKSLDIVRWHIEMTDRINLLSKESVIQNNTLQGTRVILYKLIDEMREEIRDIRSDNEDLDAEIEFLKENMSPAI